MAKGPTAENYNNMMQETRVEYMNTYSGKVLGLGRSQ